MIRKPKRGRTCGDDRLYAEMLQTGCRELLESIAGLFTDVLRGVILTPDSWKKSRLVVLHKKGDPEVLANYRPIAIVPVLFKLYSAMVLSRIQSKIEDELPPEQAGFRSGMGITFILCACVPKREKGPQCLGGVPGH